MRVLCTILALLLVSASVFAQDEMLTYISDDGAIYVDFPQGWRFESASGGVIFASDAIALDKALNDYDVYWFDETVISILFFPSDVTNVILGVEDDTAEARLARLAETIDSDIDVGSLQSLDNGLNRVRFRKGNDYMGILTVWDVADDLTGVALMMTSTDNLDQADELTQAMLLSVVFNTTVDELIADIESAGE